jgi:hypothetical protein
VVLTKPSPAGDSLVYSTYLPESAGDGVTVDAFDVIP